MSKYIFQVQGMGCESCVSKVQAALRTLTDKVEVDLGTKLVKVESDRSVAEFLTALDEAGYPGIQQIPL